MYSISKLDLTFSFDLFLRSAVSDIKATHLLTCQRTTCKASKQLIIIYIYVTMFYIIFLNKIQI